MEEKQKEQKKVMKKWEASGKKEKPKQSLEMLMFQGETDSPRVRRRDLGKLRDKRRKATQPKEQSRLETEVSAALDTLEL